MDRFSDPCAHLGICEEDLDEVQIDAAAAIGLRPPYPGEALTIPWSGPEVPVNIEQLAEWMVANGRPLDAPREA